MNQPDYRQHDLTYIELQKNGFVGWGGEAFQRRMSGWKATVESLVRSDRFPTGDARVLEIGSGAGDALIPFAERGYQVTGIEISSTAVKWAKRKFSERGLRGDFFQGDISGRLPFQDSAFSAILDGACLHCLIGPDRAAALAELFRVLRPEGFLLVSHMVNDPRELGAGIVYNPTSRTQERGGIPYRTMPKYEQLVSEIRAAGFEVIRESVRQNAWWDHAELWCLKKPRQAG